MLSASCRRSLRFLAPSERETISRVLARGAKLGRIAVLLGRPRSVTARNKASSPIPDKVMISDLALPEDPQAVTVAEALQRQVQTLPEQSCTSITWDQGSEMAAHVSLTIATDIAVYFCDPHAPRQRGSSENINGLIRQYLPKGTDLSGYSQADLDEIAAKLNDRPRERLGFMKPSEMFNQLMLR